MKKESCSTDVAQDMADDNTMDIDEDTNDNPEEANSSTRTQATKQEEEQDMFDLTRGLLGVDEAILQSIDKCGKLYTRTKHFLQISLRF